MRQRIKILVIFLVVIILGVLLVKQINKRKSTKKWTKAQKSQLRDILAQHLVCPSDSSKTKKLIDTTAAEIMSSYTFAEMSDPAKTAEIDKILSKCIKDCRCKVLPWDLKDRDAAMQWLETNKIGTFCPINAGIDLAMRGCIVDNQSHVVTYEDWVKYWTKTGDPSFEQSMDPKIVALMDDSIKHCQSNIPCVAPTQE